MLATADAVIDTTGGAELLELAPAIFRAVSEAAVAVRPPNAAKLTFIQTSGTWVHGDNRDEVVTDTTPANTNVPLVAWRVEHEQTVIASRTMNGIIIRPSLLYGRSGSILGLLFKQAYDGEIAWYGTPGGRYALVHQDDLADLFVKVVERASLIPGSIIDASNDLTESVDDILATLVKVSGAKGYKYIAPTNREFVHTIPCCSTLTGVYSSQHSKRPLQPQPYFGHILPVRLLGGTLVSRVWLMALGPTMPLGRHLRDSDWIRSSEDLCVLNITSSQE